MSETSARLQLESRDQHAEVLLPTDKLLSNLLSNLLYTLVWRRTSSKIFLARDLVAVVPRTDAAIG
jgi:hypothetical protein